MRARGKVLLEDRGGSLCVCVCLCVAGAVGCWELKSINGEDTAVSNYWGS